MVITETCSSPFVALHDEKVSITAMVQFQPSQPAAIRRPAHWSWGDVPSIKVADQPNTFGQPRFTAAGRAAKSVAGSGPLLKRSVSITRLGFHTARIPFAAVVPRIGYYLKAQDYSGLR